jgi:hypothetical protein
MFWKIPKIWDRSTTVYIIGGGPSVNSLDLTKIHDKHVIGVNDAYQFGDWVDFTLFGDFPWFSKHKKDLLQYKGIVCSCNDKTKSIQWVRTSRRLRDGLSEKPDAVCWCGNSGASAVNLGTLLGAGRIVLLGFDMGTDDKGNANWHKPFNPAPNTKVYPKFIRNFKSLSEQAEKQGIKILNANPNSNLPYFEFCDYDEITQE